MRLSLVISGDPRSRGPNTQNVGECWVMNQEKTGRFPTGDRPSP
jgi:hypothetical protein